MKLTMIILALAMTLASCGGGGSSASGAAYLAAVDQQQADAKMTAQKTVNCSEMDSEGCGAGGAAGAIVSGGGGDFSGGHGASGSWGGDYNSSCAIPIECPSCICNGPAPRNNMPWSVQSPYTCVQGWVMHPQQPTVAGTVCYGRNPAAWSVFLPTPSNSQIAAATVGAH